MQGTRMAHARAHDARTEIRSRLSPSRLEASSPELLHTCSYMLSVPVARLTYIHYRLGYRASDDIRSLQKTPNIVASAINQNKHMYMIRAIGTDTA